MKHYILLSVTVPHDDEIEKIAAWQTLQQLLASKAKTSKDIVVLAPNVWLCPRGAGMLFVAECVARANKHEIQHHIWFLDEEDA